MHSSTHLLLPICGFFFPLSSFVFASWCIWKKGKFSHWNVHWDCWLTAGIFFASTSVWLKGPVLAQHSCPVDFRFGVQTRTPPCLQSAGDNTPESREAAAQGRQARKGGQQRRTPSTTQMAQTSEFRPLEAQGHSPTCSLHMPVPCWLKEPLLQTAAHPKLASHHKGQIH